MKKLTSKQRAFLRRFGHRLNPIFSIGQSGVTPEITEAIDKALTAREMLKINVLNNCDEDIHDICDTLCTRLHAEPVQLIGHKIVIYRTNPEKPIYELPA